MTVSHFLTIEHLVNPPIWWLDPNDVEALKIEDGKIVIIEYFPRK